MINKNKKIELLRKMILIREFENEVSKCKEEKLIYGIAHCCNGEEAIAVGVCEALKSTDVVVSNHRPHGHALAKGADPKKMMAEIFGKADGTNLGKGGSMHIQDSKIGLIASSGIVGSGIPVGCGAAYAAKYLGKDNISCVFFGDGSANEGILHESLNLASTWNLPVLFVLEDNGLAITTDTRITSSCNDYVKLASAFGIKGKHLDGQDVELVYGETLKATKLIREKSKPFLIQAHTIRFNEHAEGPYYRRMIEKKYRDYAELEKYKKKRCPINLYISKLKKSNTITDDIINMIYKEVKETIKKSIEYASLSENPELSQAFTHVYKESNK